MQMIFGSSKAPVADIDVLNLSGTEGTPKSVSKTSVNPSSSVQAGWLVAANTISLLSIEKGEIQAAGWLLWDTPSYASDNSSTDWVIPHDFDATYYVRATLVAGSNPLMSSGMDVWLSLVPEGANREWRWLQSVEGEITGTIKLEIASDSDGNDVLATGYYKATATYVVV